MSDFGTKWTELVFGDSEADNIVHPEEIEGVLRVLRIDRANFDRMAASLNN